MTTEKTLQRNDIGFVTTCKGRLHHIQRTLPLIVAQSPAEVVLVDYGCPQGVGDWVESAFPSVKVVRAMDDPGFCVSRARNIGARNVSSPWICFTDADVMVAPGWVDWMRSSLNPGFFYVREKLDGLRDRETFGTVLCSRQNFDSVNGYDEVFRGWGGEDEDFFDRLSLSGTKEAAFPSHFIGAISHDDSERVTFQTLKNLSVQHMLSIFYRAAKMQIMAFTNVKTELPIGIRQRLDTTIRDAFVRWDGNRSKPLPSVTFEINCSGWLPAQYKMHKQCSFTLTVKDVSASQM